MKESVVAGLVLVLVCCGVLWWMFPPGTIRLENGTGETAYNVYVLYPGGALTAHVLAPQESIRARYRALGEGHLTVLVESGGAFDQVAIESYVGAWEPDFDLRLTSLDPLEVEDRSSGGRPRRFRARPRPARADNGS